MRLCASSGCALVLLLGLVAASGADEPALTPAPDAFPESASLAEAPEASEAAWLDYAPITWPVWGEPICARWTARVDGMFLARSKPEEQTVLVDIDSIDVFDVQEFDLGHEVGPRLSLMRHTPSGWDIEFNFFWLQWSENADFPLLDGTVRVDQSFGLDVVSADFHYDSDLLSAELNFRRPVGWFTPLVGLRWLGLYEQYGVRGVGVDTLPYDIRYDADNNLVGGQIGAEADIWNRGGVFRLNGFGKAGIFVNIADSSASMTDFDSIEDDDADVAFAGELGIEGALQLSNRLSIHGGYQLLWLDGVALGPEQVPATVISSEAGSAIDIEGDTFFHGPFAGLEFIW